MDVRKKKGTKAVETEPIESLLYSCELKNGKIILDGPIGSQARVLNHYGFGKGTLSRSAPDFELRSRNGCPGVSKEDPFAAPPRFAPQRSESLMSGLTAAVPERQAIGAPDIEEEYQIGWEEALYLVESYGEQFQVRNTDSTASLSAALLHQELQRMDSNFSYRYFAFKHFRQAGWIVKPGGRSGVDLLLYAEGGPQLVHAQYGVALRIQSRGDSESHELVWPIAARVLDSIAKSLMLAVITPVDNDNDLRFEGWKLEEIVLSRWQSTMASNV